MTLPVWPEALPRPTRAGHSSQMMDARTPRAVQAGPPSRRRKFSAVPRRIALELRVQRYEKDVLDLFFAESLDHGTRPFWMPDPEFDDWPLLDGNLVALLDREGRPVTNSAMMLTLWGDEPPQTAALRGTTFTITFAVLRMP